MQQIDITDTIDRRNPKKPVDVENLPLFTGWYIFQVVSRISEPSTVSLIVLPPLSAWTRAPRYQWSYIRDRRLQWSSLGLRLLKDSKAPVPLWTEFFFSTFDLSIFDFYPMFHAEERGDNTGLAMSHRAEAQGPFSGAGIPLCSLDTFWKTSCLYSKRK